MKRYKFSGITVPIVTPFDRNKQLSLNAEAIDPLIEKLIRSGISAIFTFGSNGEFHVCTDEEKIHFTKHVVETVSGRVPVYMGVGDCSTRRVIDLAKHAEYIGANAISVVNPYFLPLSDSELIDYFESVAESVEIPTMVYNIPKATGQNISSAVVKELSKNDRIQSIKDSSGSLENLKEYLSVIDNSEMDVLVGSDGLIFKAYNLGVSGAVAGTANLISEILCKLWKALEVNDPEAKVFQAGIEPLRDVLHLSSTPAMLKRSLELAGYSVGSARPPVQDISSNDDAIISMLKSYRVEGFEL